MDDKLIAFWICGIIAIIVILSGVGIIIYSTQTAKTLCEEQGMIFYDLMHEGFVDTEDDVICYVHMPMLLNNQTEVTQLILFYFKR